MPAEVKGTRYVEGEDRGDVMLYALSTCGWCRKTKNLLSELGVAYRYVDVDLLDPGDAEQVNAEVRKWNPRASFPTVVINNRDGIAGFDESRIREALGK